MNYETPTLDLVGQASELIQASAGPSYDGGAYLYSFGLSVCSALEEE